MRPATSWPALSSSSFECSRLDQKVCRSRTTESATVSGAWISKKVARENDLTASGRKIHASRMMPSVTNGRAWSKRLGSTGGFSGGGGYPAPPVGVASEVRGDPAVVLDIV